MKNLLFIRHGATEGNLERRYIGRTDEPLCDAGIGEITKRKGKVSADLVIASPMIRTRQTAEILFPDMSVRLVEDFRETDFGIFEGKTYQELSDTPEYQMWLSTGCRGPVPGGEDIDRFKARCIAAFQEVASVLPEEHTAAFVVHGGVIMAILEAYACPKQDFYSYYIQNGEVLCCEWESEKLWNVRKLPVD